jgi:alkane 1-monooxygenase
MKFSMRGIKYIAVFLLPLTALLSLNSSDWKTYFTLLYAFGIIPLMEWVMGKSSSNLSAAERELARQDKFYDFLLYLTVPVQLAILVCFLYSIDIATQSTSVISGKILAMGIMCGVYGINVAHELGHRANPFEKFLARVMLASSLYLHFYIEHNRGHHRNVGTSDDPATARRNEPIYTFWVRTLVGSFFSAWHIVAKERRRKGLKVWSPSNEIIQYILIQAGILFLIYRSFGIQIMLCFVFAAVIGILLLETVNYVEHYGLTRKKLTAQRYEDVQAWHSWNSDYILGRLVLFELTRHSDHHWEPSRHYQELDSMPHARQMPAGYPAMMLLSLLPPLWFKVMNHRIN